ncbi:MAG: mandelate racemase/muconate lactonizing enzyme family protein [Pseudomonadota bacterium]
MPVQTIRVTPYTLTLKRPWYGARARMDARAGWLVAVADAAGRIGYGDCSPSPSASHDLRRNAESALARLADALSGVDVAHALERTAAVADVPAPARCALETALLDLRAQVQGVALARMLNAGAAASVRVNASLGRLDNDIAIRAEAAVLQGYTVMKVKVGVFDAGEEVKRLTRLAAALPGDVRLRLDANRAWRAEGAQRFIAGAAALPVEALEEPLDDPVPEAFMRLQGEAPFPLALDESLPHWLSAHPEAALAVRRWVLKPMRWGGARRCLTLAAGAAKAGIDVVVTTTVDSAAGSWLAVHVAAAVNNGLAHGLGTSEWLAEDLGSAPAPENGMVAVPPLGLGFKPSMVGAA